MPDVRRKLLLYASALTISAAGAKFIMQEEGTVQTAYLDAVGIPTICTGSTTNVFLGQTATLAECEQRLQEDTTYAGKAVGRLVAVKLTQGQYDALVSFVFNVGPGAFAKSTLLKRINAGQCEQAGQEFLRWDRAGGQRLKGLTKRRAKESAMWTKDCYD